MKPCHSVIKLNPPYDMMVDLDKNFSWSGRVGSGRVEHTLHELLNHLLDYSDEAKSILDDLRNACNPKPRMVQVENLVY